MPRVRCERSASAEADARAGHRSAGEYGFGKLGREARLFHQLSPGELGQTGRGQRTVPPRLRMERPGVEARVLGGFCEGKARAPARDELRLEQALQLKPWTVAALLKT